MRHHSHTLITFVFLICFLTSFVAVFSPRHARAGGPIVVGGTFGVSGQPFLWDLANNVGTVANNRIQYRTDGGALGKLNNADANTRVGQMFATWENVPTSSIAYNNAGPINSVAGFSDGDVSTVPEFNAVSGDSDAGNQTAIIYDANGAIFDSIFGPNSGILGFAGPGLLDSNGRILSGLATLNGRFLDNNFGNGELSDGEFDAVFIHEFGHLSGLEHSQINLNCLRQPASCPDNSPDSLGLPTMFPILLSGLEESAGIPAQRTPSTDDAAWISRFYPDVTFSATHGTITGAVFFSDGVTPVQGVNVIARQQGDPRRVAASAVSGFLFTENAGQSVTGTNTGGSSFSSRSPGHIGFFSIPVPIGAYSLEVESVDAGFTGGSSVGPFSNASQIPMPGAAPASLPSGIVVAAGATVANQDITLVGTAPRFDSFEGASNSSPEAPPGPPARRTPPAFAILDDRLRLAVRA